MDTMLGVLNVINLAGLLLLLYLYGSMKVVVRHLMKNSDSYAIILEKMAPALGTMGERVMRHLVEQHRGELEFQEIQHIEKALSLAGPETCSTKQESPEEK